MHKLNLTVTLIMLLATGLTYAQITDVANIGSPIAESTAKQWIENYRTKYSTSSEHTMERTLAEGLLQSPGIAGVYIMKGVDHTGTERLIISAAGENGSVMENSTPVLTHCAKGIPAGMASDNTSTQKMVKRFEHGRTEGTFNGYVFGKKVIEQLLLQQGAVGIYIAKGLDENNVEHLVLAAIDKDGKTMWTQTWNHGSGI